MFSWFRRSKTTTDQSDWVVILSTDNASEAYIVAGRLQHEGIPAWVHQQPGVSGLGITVGVLGEVRVLVNAQDYDAAAAILATEPPDMLEADNADIHYIFPNIDNEHDDIDE